MITRSRSGEKGFLLSLASMGHSEQATPASHPPKDGSHEDRWVLAGVTLDFTAGAWKRYSPAGTITPLPRQSLIPKDCFTALGGKCLLGGGSFWVSVSEKPVWIVTMTLIQERFVNAKQMSPEWQNPHTSPEGSLTM